MRSAVAGGGVGLGLGDDALDDGEALERDHQPVALARVRGDDPVVAVEVGHVAPAAVDQPPPLRVEVGLRGSKQPRDAHGAAAERAR